LAQPEKLYKRKFLSAKTQTRYLEGKIRTYFATISNVSPLSLFRSLVSYNDNEKNESQAKKKQKERKKKKPSTGQRR
jgi:hypothetical protein